MSLKYRFSNLLCDTFDIWSKPQQFYNVVRFNTYISITNFPGDVQRTVFDCRTLQVTHSSPLSPAFETNQAHLWQLQSYCVTQFDTCCTDCQVCRALRWHFNLCKNRPHGLRFRPVGLRFRPVGLRFRPQGLRSSVFVFGSSFSTHPAWACFYRFPSDLDCHN